MYASYSSLTLTGNTFQNNCANDCLLAGAVCAWLSYITLTENSFYGNSADWGGSLAVVNSTLTLIGNMLQNNSAIVYGGVLFVQNSVGNLRNNTFQNNNCSQNGGALGIFNSKLNLTENTFQYNFALGPGGTLVVISSSALSLTGNTFCNNSALLGGALAIVNPGSTLNLTGNTFQSNTADGFGGALYFSTGELSITGNMFWNNSAESGGALFVNYSTLSVTRNTFQSNFVTINGGALYISTDNLTFTDNYFTNNSAQFGGALFVPGIGNSTVGMHGKIIIRNNKAQYGGGITALGSQLEFIGNTIFSKNTAVYGGGLYSYNTGISGKTTFTDNSATEGGGGVYAASSVLHLKGNITIMKNSAMDGGGLLLSDKSKFFLQPDTHVYFISNSATSTGGGIKIEEHNPLAYCIHSTPTTFDVSSSDCFLQLQNQTEHWKNKVGDEIKTIIKELNVGIYFHNNSAVEAGGDLHGGSIDNCKLSNFTDGLSGFVFDDIVDTVSKLDISSDPLYICTCKFKDSQMDCGGYYVPEPVYPGGTLEVPVLACGQRYGITAAVIKSH